MEQKILDELIVVKRSGQRVSFNGSKIAIAIKNAFDSVYAETDEKSVYKVYEKVLEYIILNYQDRKTINVEDIQDIIEKQLQKEKDLTVYNHFSEYRQKRAASRKAFSEKQQHKFVKAIEKIAQDNMSGSNKYLSPYNALYQFGKTVSSEYTKSYVLDNKYVRAHDEGNIFIHDIDYFYLGILPNVHLKLDTKIVDDNHLDNLLRELTSVHNEVNNEIAIDGIDYLLEPWVLNKYKHILKININNYLKSNGILDYINIKKIEEVIDKIDSILNNLDIFETFILNKTIWIIFENAIQDSLKYLDNTIKDSLMKILNSLDHNYYKNTRYTISFGTNQTDIGKYLNNSLLAIIADNNYSSNISFVFKINHKTDYKLLEKVALLVLNRKNISLSFVENSYNKDKKEVEYYENGGRIFENLNSIERVSTGRMVVCSTSINMARLGLKYQNEDLKSFYKELDEIADLVKNELLLSFETIGDKKKENYQVLFNNNIYDDEKLNSKQSIRKVLKNGTLNIGLIGLKECILSLESNEEKQYVLLQDILKYMNQKCQKFSEESKLNFAIYEPNDYKSRRELIAIDKAIYGIKEKITDNSNYDLIYTLKIIKDDYQKLSEVQKLFTGGQLLTVTLPKNTTVKKIIETINLLVDYDVGFAKVKVGKE